MNIKFPLYPSFANPNSASSVTNFSNQFNINNLLNRFSSKIYFTNIGENDPIVNGKFTNEQYGQFTYILFKNFEAKKIESNFCHCVVKY